MMNVKEMDNSNVTETSMLTYTHLGSSSVEQKSKCTKRKKCMDSYDEGQQERIKSSNRKNDASLNEEQREKRRESNRKYSAKLSDEQREKRRESNRKYQASLSEKQREKRKAYLRQYQAKLTEEQRERRRANNRKYQNSLTEERLEKRKAYLHKYQSSLTKEQHVTSAEYPAVPSANNEIENECETSSSEIKVEKNETSCDEYQLQTSPDNECNYVPLLDYQYYMNNEYQISSTEEKSENCEANSDGRHRRRLPINVQIERRKESQQKYLDSLTGERLEKYKAARKASALKYANSLTHEVRERLKAKRLQFLASLSEEELEKRKFKQRENARRYRIMLTDEQRAMHRATRQRRRMMRLKDTHAALLKEKKCTPQDSYVYCNIPDTNKHCNVLIKEEVDIEYSPESSDYEPSNCDK